MGACGSRAEPAYVVPDCASETDIPDSGTPVSAAEQPPPLIPAPNASEKVLRRRLTLTRDVELDFELGKTLGSGSFSKVVLGVRRSDGVRCALKILNERAMENARVVYEEIATLQSLRHPNICAVMGAYNKNGVITIVMELLEGQPLLDHIVELGAYSEAQSRDTAKTLLGAVAYMHERGVVHRDLKPENVLMGAPRGHAGEFDVKIADYGVAFLHSHNVVHRDLKPENVRAARTRRARERARIVGRVCLPRARASRRCCTPTSRKIRSS